MFFVQFEGTPRRDARLFANAAGAFINCWVERPTLHEAVDVARASVEAEGWIVGEPEEAYPVDATDYPPGAKHREYFQQALVDKEVFVYHRFPDQDAKDGNRPGK